MFDLGKSRVERGLEHRSWVVGAQLQPGTEPGLLVIYHHSNAGGGPLSADTEDVLLTEIRQDYKGRVVGGHDLDVF